MRGYFGIGVYHPNTSENIGTLWRHARLYGASFIFTVGRRYKNQASDTSKTYRGIPLYNYTDYEDFRAHIPYDCPVVCIELSESATALPDFKHPERCIYLLGAEDYGIPAAVLEGKQVIEIPSIEPESMNVAVSGTLVMYDRLIKAAVPSPEMINPTS
jgi:tRNA(Leu) C34 or U34 (ribose-2'-O)-methylase TrmL